MEIKKLARGARSMALALVAPIALAACAAERTAGQRVSPGDANPSQSSQSPIAAGALNVPGRPEFGRVGTP